MRIGANFLELKQLKIVLLQKIKNRLLRIPENNDWVLFSVLGVAAAYVFMFRVLLRGIGAGEFLSQPKENVHNYFPAWAMITVGFSVLLSVLFSQYIPVVPEFLINILPNGYQINKFGFMLGSLLVFYLVKGLLTYIFYAAIGALHRTKTYILTAYRVYFAASLVLMLACLVHYYLPINRFSALKIYCLAFFVSFVVKLILYFFSSGGQILPKRWFYKILYICTLQIVPLLVLVKFLFL
jgi:hypothetical protein